MTMYIKPYRHARHPAERHQHNHQVVRSEVHVPLNVRVEGDEYLIELIVPGLEPEELDIEIVENTIAIEGEFPAVEEEVKFLRQELPTGKFRRVIKLPNLLDMEAVEANLTQGILSLRVPVAEEARPRMIKVKAK